MKKTMEERNSVQARMAEIVTKIEKFELEYKSLRACEATLTRKIEKQRAQKGSSSSTSSADASDEQPSAHAEPEGQPIPSWEGFEKARSKIPMSWNKNRI